MHTKNRRTLSPTRRILVPALLLLLLLGAVILFTTRLQEITNEQEVGVPYVQIGHLSGISSFALSPDGKMIASGSYDRSIKLWEVASGRELVQLSASQGVWIAITPEGYFAASKNAEQYLNIRSGAMSVWGLNDSERQKFYRPDLLAAILQEIK